MMKMDAGAAGLSGEKQLKADFMMEVAHVIMSVDHRHISIEEGYDKLMHLLGNTEIEQILQIIYHREKGD